MIQRLGGQVKFLLGDEGEGTDFGGLCLGYLLLIQNIVPVWVEPQQQEHHGSARRKPGENGEKLPQGCSLFVHRVASVTYRI